MRVKIKFIRIIFMLVSNTIGDMDEIVLQGNDLESVMMSNKEGQSYMCFLPLVEETKTLRSITQQNSSNALLESDRRIKLKTPDELIDVIKDKCFYRVRVHWIGLLTVL